MFSRHYIPTNGVAPFSEYKHAHNSLGCHTTLPPGVIGLGCKAHLKHRKKYGKHYESEISFSPSKSMSHHLPWKMKQISFSYTDP